MKKLLLILGLIITFSNQVEARPIQGGIAINQYGISIGSNEYRNYLDVNHQPTYEKVWVPAPTDRTGQYARLYHLQTYAIRLYSSHVGRSNAVVEIDGKVVGKFRIQPQSSVTIERSRNNPKKFTFVRNGTPEFFDADLNGVAVDKRGLIKVTFYPEKFDRYTSENERIEAPGLSSKDQTENYAPKSGGTGLSGMSDQNFVDAPEINVDHNKKVTIYLRLIEDFSYDHNRLENQVNEHRYRHIVPLESQESNTSKFPEPVER